MKNLEKTLDINAYTILNLVEALSEVNETLEGADVLASNRRIMTQLEHSNTLLSQMLQSISDRKDGR
jgi:hypothetical protein